MINLTKIEQMSEEGEIFWSRVKARLDFFSFDSGQKEQAALEHEISLLSLNSLFAMYRLIGVGNSEKNKNSLKFPRSSAFALQVFRVTTSVIVEFFLLDSVTDSTSLSLFTHFLFKLTTYILDFFFLNENLNLFILLINKM